MFICQVLCTGIQGICAVSGEGPTGIQGICAVSGGSICQSVFICQVLCTGIQGIYAVSGVSIGQSRFICQVLCTGIQGINALFVGGPLAKEGSSAKYCVLVFKATILTSIQGNLSH